MREHNRFSVHMLKISLHIVLGFDLQIGKVITTRLRTENTLVDNWRDDETYATRMWYLAVITRQDNATQNRQ